MQNDIKIYVVIVTYNGSRWYDRCLLSLQESTIPVSVVVVDNASTDGGAQYIRSNYSWVYLIESRENLGFGKANNLGLRYAMDKGCDYVFLLNQDTWVERNSIEELIRIHKYHQDFGVLSPMHVRADGKSLYIQIEDGKSDHGNKLLGDCYFGTLDDVYPVSYINAAAWLVPRKTLETVGGFDPIFVHYGEDNDYLNRVKYHGGKIGLCPKVRIVHDHQDVHNPLSAGRMRDYQTQIVRLIDPNNSISLGRHILSLMKKGLYCFLTGKLKEAGTVTKDVVFWLKNRRRIKQSRKTNRQKQSSWL